MKITSLNNDLIKETAKLLQKKYRDESGLFLIEGEKGVKEAGSSYCNGCISEHATGSIYCI